MFHSMHKWCLNSFTCPCTFWLLPGLSCLNAAAYTLVCTVAVVQSLPGQLIAGHMDQAKSQWAAGEAAAVISSQQTVQLSRDQSCPLSSGPESGVFLQHLCGTTKAQDRHHQGSVFNIIMAAVKTAPHGTEGTGGAALRHGGEEANRAHLCTQPGGHRSSLVSTIEAQPAETWCPNQGSCHPRCRVWEGVHPRDCGCVTLGAGSGRWATLETGRVTPGAGSGRWVTLETVDVWP